MIGINNLIPDELFLVSGMVGLLIFALYVPYYLYSSYVYYKLGLKAGISNSWVAFIPTGSFYIKLKISKLPFLLIFLPIFIFFIILFIPYIKVHEMLLLLYLIMFLVVILVNMVVSIVMDWRVLEYFGKPGVVSLSVFLGIGQIVMLILYSIVAFEKGINKNELKK